jgi:hypothetical protein
VGGGGVRAPRVDEQAWCHGERAAPRPDSSPQSVAVEGGKLAAGLGNRAALDPLWRGRPHSVVLSGCEGGRVPQNGNPGSEQCAAARLAEEVG